MTALLDRRALDGLYRSHGAMVLRRARSILRDDAAAEDVLQEVFSSLVARPEQFAGRCQPSTLLYAMTTHLCLQKLRDGGNRARLEKLHLALGERSAEASADWIVLRREVLAALPEDQASACVYAYVDGLTWDEIAEVLGCSRRHVANLISRARETALASDAPAPNEPVTAANRGAR